MATWQIGLIIGLGTVAGYLIIGLGVSLLVDFFVACCSWLSGCGFRRGLLTNFCDDGVYKDLVVMALLWPITVCALTIALFLSLMWGLSKLIGCRLR